MEEYIKIGQIVNTFGHKGEVKVYPLTDDSNRFLELDHVFIKDTGGQFTTYHLRGARIQQNVVILDFAEIPDMNAAIRLKGSYLELPQAELRPLPAGHYYIFQIVGLAVYEGEQLLGKISDVSQTGANDIYLVETPQNTKFYLPAIKDVIKEIDLQLGRMTVIIPPGLLD